MSTQINMPSMLNNIKLLKFTIQEDLKSCDKAQTSNKRAKLLQALENVAYELIELIDDESLVSKSSKAYDFPLNNFSEGYC